VTNRALRKLRARKSRQRKKNSHRLSRTMQIESLEQRQLLATISINDITVKGENAQFTASLSEPAPGAITVDFNTISCR